MALAAPRREIPTGSASPRLAPPLPIAPLAAELEQVARGVDLPLWPWQSTAARYLMAQVDGKWRYREVCIVVARQNGKTTLLIPRILWGLQNGRRIVHTAQNREIPREAFIEVAARIDPKLLARKIRFANGQEKIVTKNGGSYRIIAPQRGARGLSADDLIIDEAREFDDWDFIGAAVPTLTASANPQVIYLSNAGHDKSVVLNQLRDSTAEQLCYLEWSADPELDAADQKGWVQANPALGHKDGVWETLEYDYASGRAAMFETEHLCRWVNTMSSALVNEFTWRQCQATELEPPKRPGLGVALDPSGTRVSAYLGWQQSDGSVAVQAVLEHSGAPVDVDAIGKQLRQLAMKNRARMTAYSGTTDVALAQYLAHAKPVDGRMHAQASASFATLAESGRLRVISSELLDEDLKYTIRRDHHDGAWSAARADESRPITSALACVRAAWLAAMPKPPAPRIG